MSLKRNVALMQGLRYQGKGPMLAFILHRVSGLGILLFVGLHMLASYLANQPWGADAGVFINTIYEGWLFQVFMLFFALFHVINGLRILILDIWPRLVEHQREAIWMVWFVFLPVYAIALIVILNSGLGG